MAAVLHTNPFKYWAANVSLSARLGRILHYTFIEKMTALRKQNPYATGMNLKQFTLGVVAILLIVGAAVAASMVPTLGLGLGLGLFVGLAAAAAAHAFAGDYLYSKAGARTLAGAALMPFVFVLDVVFSPFSFIYASVNAWASNAYPFHKKITVKRAKAIMDSMHFSDDEDDELQHETSVVRRNKGDKKLKEMARVIKRGEPGPLDPDNQFSDFPTLTPLDPTIQVGDDGTVTDGTTADNTAADNTAADNTAADGTTTNLYELPSPCLK
ncbi:MAG: hypothetical protein DHS20C10_13990 [marine bacterium B5-7]|nr:MAG: hypothetical protein NMNS01_28080 [Nitrosomonas sp.]GJM07665.1 MAG: hypothetical protein DHS20C10_13990 [marine bacterium B5-7]